MKLIKAILRPNKLEEVKDALTKLSVAGMTVTEVRGHGRQKGHKAVYRGTEYSVTLLPKIMIELVIQDEMTDDVIKTIIETARTGEIGDGRVFVIPIEQGYNIRTGERDVVRVALLRTFLGRANPLLTRRSRNQTRGVGSYSALERYTRIQEMPRSIRMKLPS